jgi:acyl-CoA reductase-like NAD-dependent aldehyde dehydrogenase
VTPIPVAGDEVHTGDGVLDVVGPWRGELVGRLPLVGADATRSAIDGAAEAMQARLPAHERAAILDRVAAQVRERRGDLARLLALEVGKPIKHAQVEVDRTVQTLTFSAVAARTLAGTGVPMDAHPAGGGRLGFTLRVPIGVIGAITPFNFPLNLAAHKIGPAVAAGCAAVVKPARSAPLSVVELVRMFHACGLPAAWLSVLIGPPEDVVEPMITDDRVRMLTFTGSAQVGWELAARSPKKKVSLELGNSTPLIVAEDADLEAAAAAVAGSGFAFAGQSCISIQRVLVHDSVDDEFTDLLQAATRHQVLGDPLEPGTDLGPLIDADSRNRVSEWIGEAEDLGAVRTSPPLDRDAHLPPVILDRVPLDARVWSREVFGPVIGVRTYDRFEEAIELANGTEYGLQAGVFTRSMQTALTAIESLDFGGVTVNETPTFRVDHMPYGGTKDSGNTREGPHYAVREMTEERMIVLRP